MVPTKDGIFGIRGNVESISYGRQKGRQRSSPPRAPLKQYRPLRRGAHLNRAETRIWNSRTVRERDIHRHRAPHIVIRVPANMNRGRIRLRRP